MPAVQIIRPTKPRMAQNWVYQGWVEDQPVDDQKSESVLKRLGMRVSREGRESIREGTAVVESSGRVSEVILPTLS
jgi:hypothetical protein